MGVAVHGFAGRPHLQRPMTHHAGRGKRPRATLQQKVQILDYLHAKKCLQVEAVQHFKHKVAISKSSINEWLKHEAELRLRLQAAPAAAGGQKRRVKFKYEQINLKMDALVEANPALTGPQLRVYWRKYAHKFGVDDPKRLEGFSHGWFEQFKKRHNLHRGAHETRGDRGPEERDEQFQTSEEATDEGSSEEAKGAEFEGKMFVSERVAGWRGGGDKEFQPATSLGYTPAVEPYEERRGGSRLLPYERLPKHLEFRNDLRARGDEADGLREGGLRGESDGALRGESEGALRGELRGGRLRGELSGGGLSDLGILTGLGESGGLDKVGEAQPGRNVCIQNDPKSIGSEVLVGPIVGPAASADEIESFFFSRANNFFARNQYDYPQTIKLYEKFKASFLSEKLILMRANDAGASMAEAPKKLDFGLDLVPGFIQQPRALRKPAMVHAVRPGFFLKGSASPPSGRNLTSRALWEQNKNSFT